MLASVKNRRNGTIYDKLMTIIQEGKKETRQMNPLFSTTFWALTICDNNCCIWKLLKLNFMGSTFLSTMVYKIAEFCRWKLWDQNFSLLDSRNIHIQESKKYGFTFSVELRANFKIFSVISWSIQSAAKSGIVESLKHHSTYD